MGASWTWQEFYKGRLLSATYRAYAANRYAPFLAAITSKIKLGDLVIEVGCGLGTMTALLAADPHRPFCGFRCYDICPEMVALSQINLQHIYPVELGDARYPTNRYPNIVHSHGMLEHLSDSDIRNVIAANKADGARFAIHYVPGNLYKKPSFGDERLLSVEQWRSVASPTTITTFNDKHDYILEWDFR